ncbi:MAG: aldo/keto reductase [Gaiellaceae bacterium]|jgi:aryl-alcohol dehydrogenase-like predicted oxidoreductase
MRLRQLGNGGLKVSAIGLGRMGMSEFYKREDDRTGLATIHRALDLGVNFLDTADAKQSREIPIGAITGERYADMSSVNG